MTRPHFNLDWVFALQRWLGDLVDQNYRRDRPLWPTLTSFDAEVYRCGPSARLFVIRDKPSAHATPTISSGDDVIAWPGELPEVTNPFALDDLVSLILAVHTHFALRAQDYAVVVPDTELASVDEDVASWSADVGAAVSWQVNFAVSRHYGYVHELDDVPLDSSPVVRGEYVESGLIEELSGLKGRWHVGKLTSMLRELNANYADGHPYACLMLCRAIMDHIPPVFGVSRFSGVVSNLPLSRTDKAYLAQLGGNRYVSDDVLHRHIRQAADLIGMEDLPGRAAMNALIRLVADRISEG